MKKLSLIILTKNEEEMIADCLDSVPFADDIILVDNGSTDRTVEIAKMKGANIFERTEHSFAQRRNVGLEKATGEWLLYLDADERLSEELQKEIKKIISDKKDSFAAYKIPRKNYFLGHHEWPTIEKLERLFKRSQLKEWYGALHESPTVTGSIGELEHPIYHFTHRNLSSMLAKTIAWSKIEAELRFQAHHPKMSWWRFPRVMLQAFYHSYVKQEGWRIGVVGLIESMFQAFSMFVTYARLWEMQLHEEQKKVPKQ